MAKKKIESDIEEKESPKSKQHGKNGEESKDVEISKNKDVVNEAEILEELEGLPPELKSGIKTFMSMQRYSGPVPSPFASKLTETHIDKIIEISAKDDERKYKDTQQARRFNLVYVLAGIFLFVFLTLFLVGKDTELFKEIIKLFIIFVGGMGAGYGIKGRIGKSD